MSDNSHLILKQREFGTLKSNVNELRWSFAFVLDGQKVGLYGEKGQIILSFTFNFMVRKENNLIVFKCTFLSYSDCPLYWNKLAIISDKYVQHILALNVTFRQIDIRA